MSDNVLGFADVGASDLPLVGGKGANLGEMTRAGMPVPPGFCITTAAFDRFFSDAHAADSNLAVLLDELDALDAQDVAGVRETAAKVRHALEAIPVDEELATEVVEAFRKLEGPVAVRSSATLEDLAEASFAGQQDTYLNVHDEATLVDRVRACWASLFTDRAVLYRRQAGFLSADAKLSVVVQRMAQPTISGIMFTADPLTGHRGQCSIDASWGLGEALVSGLVNADLYRIDKESGAPVSVHIGEKAIEIVATDGGGTETRDVDENRRAQQVLDNSQLADLATLARTVEAHYQTPQDIEWGIDDGVLVLLQTRPITSLYPMVMPVPDDGLHVYASFGHVQVMTDPMRPFGMSAIRYVLPLGKETFDQPSSVITHAGSRVFGDLTSGLRTFPLSKIFPKAMQVMDPVMASILTEVVKRPEFQKKDRRPKARRWWLFKNLFSVVIRNTLRVLFFSHDTEKEKKRFYSRMENAISAQREVIAAAPDLEARLRAARKGLGYTFYHLMPVFPPSMIAGGLSWRLLLSLTRNRLQPAQVELLTRGFEENITTQMDLELGDLADIARKNAGIRDVIRSTEPDEIQSVLEARDDTVAFLEGWHAFIARYGHRGPGEIDASNPRWRDNPTSLWVSLKGMLSSEEIGKHRDQERFAQEQAAVAAKKVIHACSRGFFGFVRKRWAQRLIKNVRTFLGLREHGKFYALQFFEMIRDIASEAGAGLVAAGQLESSDDVFFLEIDEIIEAVSGSSAATPPQSIDFMERVRERRQVFELARKWTPPRILTSEGEAPAPAPRTDIPDGALGGIPASSGVATGIARVVMDPAEEILHDGEILVAPFTDPGWTPLFVHASALVMEIGGLMTHGSVVAREYGIPAVVGIDGATTRIQTGDRIQVDGTTGFVTFLPELPAPDDTVLPP